jgi:hypothetical protein
MNPAQRKPRREVKIADETIREELSRMMASPIFAHSDRLARFLYLTVETTLAGEGEALKEYVIGTEVCDRKPPYHPNVDSIVRSDLRSSSPTFRRRRKVDEKESTRSLDG